MNAGLGNLATLKNFLLAGSLQSATDFDSKLLAIGLGTAGLFDTHCNRRFSYQVNDTQIFTGNRAHWYLPRFPFVSVASVKMRYFRTDAWTDITDQPIQQNEETGLIHFGYTLGRDPLQVQVIWTGGYWFETKEPTDGGYPSVMPAGATALPDVIKTAWLIQCSEVWNKLDKTGAGIVGEPDRLTKTGELNFSPLVKAMLEPFKRYEMA